MKNFMKWVDMEDNDHISPFNEDFCIHLEYQLCRYFDNHEQEYLRYFWCDGVSWHPTPDFQLSRKYVNDKRKIVTKAWIGIDGQGEYEMTLLFGKYSLRRYARGTSIIDCIPELNDQDWIYIDPSQEVVEIKLR